MDTFIDSVNHALFPTMTQTSNIDTIATYLSVRAHPTVVRLDELPIEDIKACQSHWITTSFVTTAEIKNHLNALENLLHTPSGCGIFIIGQYGSGKSHFLASLANQISCGQITRTTPEVKILSLINYSADNRLEDIVLGCFKLNSQSGDRRVVWQQLLHQRTNGLVLLIDELSEFLRSKSDMQAFNEDVRFLQFLGEWAQDHPLWIIAAMQEGIEHTGELEYSLYRKIKDRYPYRWLLTPAHVKTLVADSLLVKSEQYDDAVTKLIKHWQTAMPDSDIDYAQITQIYPLHPETIKFMEEIRDRFSQARGVIDFVVGQLCGDPTRQRSPFLEQPWGEVLTPDLIIDHFHDLLEVQSEFQPLAQQVFPWYEQNLSKLFNTPALIALARRLLNLLVLVFLSPAREQLTINQAINWLLFSASTLEPDKNRQIIKRILDTLCAKGRYVKHTGMAYQLDLDDDSAAVFERQLKRELTEFSDNEETMLESLANALHDPEFDIFSLPQNRWQSRKVSWHFHSRPYSIWVGNQSPTDEQPGTKLCIRFPWGTPHAITGVTNLMPAPLSTAPDAYELAALLRLIARPLPMEIKQRCQHRIQTLKSAWIKHLITAWSSAKLISAQGRSETMPMINLNRGVDDFLDQLALWTLRRQYPGFEQFAPEFGPLTKNIWQRYLKLNQDHAGAEITQDNQLKLLFEAYLVPLKLVRRHQSGYLPRANLERHELIQIIRSLATHCVSPDILYQHLSGPIYGLVQDQITALLLLLLRSGEIDILKGNHSLREFYETLPNPLNYDSIVLGQTLGEGASEALHQLCELADITLPKDASVLAQNKAIESLKIFARERIQLFEKLALDIKKSDTTTYSSHTVNDVNRSLNDQIHNQTNTWRQLLAQKQPLHAFEIFLQVVDSPRALINRERVLIQTANELPGLLIRLRQCQHLIQHPDTDAPVASSLCQQLEHLGVAPAIEQIQSLSTWCDKFENYYNDYQRHCRQQHDAWWLKQRNDSLVRWQPPELAYSQHLKLESTLNSLQQCRIAIKQNTCNGISDLQFQPLCRCRFDGESAPVIQHSISFAKIKTDIEHTLKSFFAQHNVRQRLQQWREQNLKLTPGLLAYLDDERDLPEIDDLALLDKHLSGINLVKEVSSVPIVELLQAHSWTPADLIQAIKKIITQLGGERLRFLNDADSRSISASLAQWCAEQTLRTGTPLPPALGHSAHIVIVDTLKPQWVSSKALNQLHKLGFQESAIQRILKWLANGQITIPNTINKASPVAAAASMIQGDADQSIIHIPDKLANHATTLYRHHDTLMAHDSIRWCAKLDQLANINLPQLPDLYDELESQLDAQWLIIDCFGPALVTLLMKPVVQLFKPWSAPRLGWAKVGCKTTTDHHYRSLMDARLKHGFHKIDIIDTLIHQRRYPLDELSQRVTSELSFKIFNLKLDPGKPLYLFSDHGFRISTDGKKYQHGGNSWLERMVPVWRFEVFE